MAHTSVYARLLFTCVSYAEARNSYRLDVRLSVRLSVRPPLLSKLTGPGRVSSLLSVFVS